MNRRDAIKTILLAAASTAIPTLPALPAPEPKEDFGRGLICEADAFVDYMQQQACGVPQVLVVGRPKSGKTTIINTLVRELYTNALVYSHAASACFPRAGYPTFIEANLSKSAMLEVAYGGDVFRHLSMANWENVCSADVVLLTVRAMDMQTNTFQRLVFALKNRVGRDGQMWRVG